MATLYDTLGVPDNASGDEVKRAYRKAAMKWHPDRNVGHEDAARAAFQEVKEAYSILSDAGQRAVYDAVYAEQMKTWQTHHQQAEDARIERERVAQAERDAYYAEKVSVAMRFSDDGFNRDVVFGVLLGQGCERGLAARIADSVGALQESRRGVEDGDRGLAAAAAVPPADAAAKHPAGVFESFFGMFGIRT
ncbi:J domain-containing protein [Paraburkholderia sp.]|uniref:J domain-containing protein n=1 Tax=Paraburkholderia sp. TaxID=1926495 RepID=UPI002395C9A7|nr:J domain-containing protein [Paraburkholderia sp.]MDE1181981.1 J domain-containing protein [Paraburkholderia sp.]